MKKLLNIGFLLTVALCSLNVHADDGGMTTGNKNCTQNCGGLYDGGEIINTGDTAKDDTLTDEVYGWVLDVMSRIID